MPLDAFHPAVNCWFSNTFAEPTEVQKQAWPAIRSGSHTLLAAPTGSGKTLAAFLAAIDALVREGLERGLPDETRVLYVSPLKALSNDIQRNLQQPLMGIRDELLMQGCPDVDVRAWVRTGDTPQSEREKMRRQPPHILVTTPESLFILLTSESGRQMLGSVRSVIVDEIHAVAGNKRGAHLMLSLERLEALCRGPLVRIGLSATQKPIESMARLLIGTRDEPCTIIDTGHLRERDLALELTGSPLETVMATEVWGELYDRLVELVDAHRTTLIFVNTRRLAERVSHHLAERIGDEHVTAHHGSLSRKHRLKAEQRLKTGQLRALVATASLELGIDIGDVDLVCQLGSPRGIATFLQRVGRSGHAVDQTPKGRLFPLSRDDLVECVALLGEARRGELDRVVIPDKPLDVLAQQVVGEVSGREWAETALFQSLGRAWPYKELSRDEFDQVLQMLSQGFSTRRGRRGAYLHRDAVNGRLRPRRGARLTAMTNSGAIPDQFDYDVVLSPEGAKVGTLNEDFAFESLPGDIFQLGNTSYRVLRIQAGTVHVEDARGEPPNIPFWFGEAPGRSDELSTAVSALRREVDRRLEGGCDAVIRWLAGDFGISESAAEQLTTYLAAAKAALGLVPTRERIVFERFFDEAGDMHMVIHAPLGSRLNRAWGLSLRKRFCRKFNFELQAAALEDSIILSLGATHSFPLEEVSRYLNSQTVREILVQALLAAPMFGTHWRWNANIALAVRRNRNGKRVPAQWQRSDAEDLIALVFPDQLACLENIAGNREIPDHPLVKQTIDDCLHDVMDVVGLEQLLTRLEQGEIEVIARDLTSPSPLAQDIINARPYAFLDDAPAEERRTLAVRSRRFLDPAEAADLGKLDPAAIERVRSEAWPEARTSDELHDALVVLGFLTEREGLRGPQTDREGFDFGWEHLFEQLCADRRATVLTTPGGERMWVAAERLAEFELVLPGALPDPTIDAVPLASGAPTDSDSALREIVRSRLEGLGPVTSEMIANSIGLTPRHIDRALIELEQEGFALQGRFTVPEDGPVEWCERRLLARIHRYTIKKLRSEIEPVAPADYMRFLFHWHGLDERRDGPDALAATVSQLEGVSAPAGAWESDLLPARVQDYSKPYLDQLCASGRVCWLRLSPATSNNERKAPPVRNTPIVLLERQGLPNWRAAAPKSASPKLSSPAQLVREVLESRGASFFVDLVQETGLLRTQVEDALAELVTNGLATSDAFIGLRALITPRNRRPGFGRGRRRGGATRNIDDAGRWSLLREQQADGDQDTAESIEYIARALLRRYGIVFRKVLERETGLPVWRELLRVYWRMEARGEIRGGRFVQGFSGEQFALPEAVASLREVRRKAKQQSNTNQLIVVAAADPLNLRGIVTPGDRVPATLTNRILYRDGIPVATQVAGELWISDTFPPEEHSHVRDLLVRGQLVEHPRSGTVRRQSGLSL